MELSHEQKKAWTTGGVLIALGIVFGDIGTSPLYVIQAIVGDRLVTKELLYGGVSCVFWTLFIVSTVKYVILALNADNNGEGGIFALYARVRRYNPKLVIYPAMIGCATLIADGFITPPVSISSAVEGIHVLYPNVEINTIPIVMTIIVLLFAFQQVGTRIAGVLHAVEHHRRSIWLQGGDGRQFDNEAHARRRLQTADVGKQGIGKHYHFLSPG